MCANQTNALVAWDIQPHGENQQQDTSCLILYSATKVTQLQVNLVD